MTLAQRRNRLTTHFSERIPVVMGHISVYRSISQWNEFRVTESDVEEHKNLAVKFKRVLC